MAFSLILIDFATESNLLPIRALVFVVVVIVVGVRYDRTLTNIVGYLAVEAVVVETHAVAFGLAI
jgi:hypothetical protein